MRRSLRQSIQDSPAGAGEGFRYPKGSVVLCNQCAAPVAVLERGIALGDKCGRMASALAPLRASDLDTLAHRDDIDAGLRAWARQLTPAERVTYLEGLHRFSTGDPMACPTCGQCFVQVIALDADEVLDRAYTVELLTVPPQGQKGVALRGKQLGYGKDWIHERVVS